MAPAITSTSVTSVLPYPAINHIQFIDRLRAHLDEKELEHVEAAYELAKAGHKGQYRDDGKTRYFDHVRAVAWILITELGIYDWRIIVEALLHDIREDTWLLSFRRLTMNFGLRVAHGVERLTKKSDRDYYSHLLREGSWRDLLVKLADRLHNLRTLDNCPIDKQRRKIAETREHILPLVIRLRQLRPSRCAWASYLESQIVQLCDQYEASWTTS